MTVTEKDQVLEQAEVAEAPKKSPKAKVEEAVKAEPEKKAKKTAKKAEKQPLYINGRYVVEKQLKAKPQKGSKPYELTKKKISITLVKSTNGCLQNQIKTVKALGLSKIGQSVVHLDNDAIRGMIFKVKHLVKVENA